MAASSHAQGTHTRIRTHTPQFAPWFWSFGEYETRKNTRGLCVFGVQVHSSIRLIALGVVN